MTPITFTVIGHAIPAGSKSSYPLVNRKTGQPVRGKGGRIVTVTTHGNPKTTDWMESVKRAAREAYQGDLLTGPIRLSLTFYRPRPKGHFGTGRNAESIRNGAPPLPTTKPDVTKLTRAVEDALTGVIWRDDSQVCTIHTAKRWGQYAYVEVWIKEDDHESA